MSNITQGLIISLVGLLVTFVALGVFILVMVVLQKLFPSKPETEEEEAEAEVDEALTMAAVEEDLSAEEEIAAAVTAVVLLRSQQSNQLGSALVAGPGPYWTNH